MFQNRYKSIVYEEVRNFKAHVRCIHLNPLGGGAVKKIKEPVHYPWCGNLFIMGERLNDWQDINYLLGWFGTNKVVTWPGLSVLRIQAGVAPRRRPELVGGRLLRPIGDCSAVKYRRILGTQEKAVDRVLRNSLLVRMVMKKQTKQSEIKYQKTKFRI